jgi:UDP-glucose 4-epimerase
MKTLITGGAGFIGSHLAELLISQGHEVTVVDNLTSGRLKNLQTISDRPEFRFVNADIRDIDALAPLFKDIDWVFHLAGLADIVPSIEMPAQYYSTNVTGTFNVLECARLAGVKRFLYAASSSSYGIPDTYPTPEYAPIQSQYPYALTKYMGEELVLHWAKIYKLPSSTYSVPVPVLLVLTVRCLACSWHRSLRGAPLRLSEMAPRHAISPMSQMLPKLFCARRSPIFRVRR